MSKFTDLSKNQREAIGLLSIGTFLEYFDLMIYIHMAALLNQLFFPKTDPHVAQLMVATAFCTTYIFRPLGALLFGWIGDNIGRKITVVITTTMMALSCVVMANLPTYAQIGVTATWAVTICRIMQGLSSMGEMVGAELYLTELIKPPARYPAICIIISAANLGSIAALGVATAVFSLQLSWRLIFWIGTIIALVGSVARTVLRETPEFADAKRRIKIKYQKLDINLKELKQDIIVNQKVNKKTSLSYFFIRCSGPVWLYFVYFYCADILRNSFNYNSEQVIQHNFMVACVELLVTICYAYLSYKIHPLKIVKVRLIIFSMFIIFVPYLLSKSISITILFLIQSFMCMFKTTSTPATAIFFTHFPVFKRFTYSGFLYAASRSIMYVITSFSFVYLTNAMGHWGLLVIFIPTILIFSFGINHFSHLENPAENHCSITNPNYRIS